MTKPAKKTAARAEQPGNLIALNDETKDHKRFVSLVDRPANQRAFRIVRSAAPVLKNPEPAPAKRIRRLAGSPVLKIAFPKDFEEGDVVKTLEVYGMPDYAVSKDGENYIAMRADLAGKSISEDVATSLIRMSSDGIMATVEGENIGKPGEPQLGVSVVRFEFDSKLFDNEAAGAWMIEKKVDFSGSVVENPDQSLLSIEVKPVEEDTEVRRMEVEPGVTFVIARDEDGTVPGGYVSAVNEAAYGSWGWGQLDFAASLMDRTVSEVLDDAIYVLSSTLRNILFYSQVPTVDARKQLVERACAQFADFANAMQDTLPRQVLSIVGRTEMTTEKEPSMTTKTNATSEEGKGKEAPAATTTTPAGTTTTTTTETTEDKGGAKDEGKGDDKGDDKGADAPVTRAEFNELMEAVRALKPATPAATTATATRSDAPLTKADLEDVTKGITETVTRAVKESMGETIVRGENTDQGTQTVEEKGGDKETNGTVFRGAIFPGRKATTAK